MSHPSVAPQPIVPLEVRKTLVLSTANLSKETCLTYKNWPFIAEFDGGCYFYVGEESTFAKEPPEDLLVVLDFARAQGCLEVKFDCDAEPVSQLPIFEW